MTDTPLTTDKRSKRRQRRRPVPRKVLALLTPPVLEAIFCGFRSLSNSGPSDLLNLRLVCRTWADEVPRLPDWVWIRWINPMRRWDALPAKDPLRKKYPWLERQLVKDKRALKAQESIGPRIMALRKGKACRKSGPAKELIDSKLPTTHPKPQPFFPRDHPRFCQSCDGRGQGKSKFCFKCPTLVKRRKAKQQSRAEKTP